jgi:hypothetical protein
MRHLQDVVAEDAKVERLLQKRPDWSGGGILENGKDAGWNVGP